jgi:hypothetical protein
MCERIAVEYELLRSAYSDAVRNGQWFLIPRYPTTPGWLLPELAVAFFLRPPYPAVSPYGFWVSSSLTFRGRQPQNFAAANPPPPFPGSWSIFSWEAEAWQPSADVTRGHNILTWTAGFKRRFLEGI